MSILQQPGEKQSNIMEVAILLATYNSEDYIRELLDSLNSQSYKDFVCYVHDDGSKDNTPEILQNYAETSEFKLKILSYPPTGSARSNFLSMLKYAEEPYIMFCDHDDVWRSDKIERSVSTIKTIEHDNKPALVFSDLAVVNKNLDIISDSFMRYTGLDPNRISLKDLLLENVAAGCTMIANKALYSIARDVSDYNNIPMHDHWFIITAAAIGTIGFIDDPLIYYRQHEINELGAIKKKGIADRASIILKRIVSREYKKELDKWISIRQRQAGELAKLSGLSDEDRLLCEQFSSLKEYNKIHRLRFYVSNDVKRSNYPLWFLLWC